MSDPDRLARGKGRAMEVGVNRRIEALEKEIQRWRCMTAAGFLTALGAFGLAVFGLSQLENTYFIGEMASSQMIGSALPTGGAPDETSAPNPGKATTMVFSPAEGQLNHQPGMAILPGNPSRPALTGVLGERLAATDGGS